MKRWVLAGIGLLIVGGFAHSLWHTHRAIGSIKQEQFMQAATHAQQARWLPTILSTLTFNTQPDLVSWKSGLEVLGSANEGLTVAQKYAQTAFTDKPKHQQAAAKLTIYLENLTEQTQELETSYQRSWVIRWVTPRDTIEHTLSTSNQALNAVQTLLSNQHTYLVLLQNSQELRATGGFMGTYAIVSLNNGSLERFEIQDIYVPDGQFSGYVEAPAGVKEYLSSGNGLRLPDANWHPDFPSSAQQILSFFSLAGEQHIEGVITINLPFVESLLQITGPIYIPDYDTTVTANNFATVARSDREQFFPGSQQKKQFMSSFFTQLVVTIEHLDSSAYQQLLSLIGEGARRKTILLFSQDQNVQTMFEKIGASGAIILNPDTNFYFYSVESNVGINKANKNISRAISLHVGETNSTALIVITNQNHPPTPEELKNLAPNEAKHLGYVDYHRLLVLPEMKVAKVLVNDQETAFNEEIIETAKGEKLKQLGFLVTVPEQQQAIVQVYFSHHALPPSPVVQIDAQPTLTSATHTLQTTPN